MKRYKLLEFSVDLKVWYCLNAWNEEEAPEKWNELQDWVGADQVYGFFRLIKEGYSDE